MMTQEDEEEYRKLTIVNFVRKTMNSIKLQMIAA